jgi:predicted MFS family arabinose efflux permease
MNSVFLDYLKDVGNDKAGWYRGSHSIGMVFLGPLLGVFLVKDIGYSWTFVTVSLSLLATVIIAGTVLTDRKKDNEIAIFSFNGTFSHIKSLLKNKELVEASVAEALAIAAFSCFNTFIVVIALRVFHLSKEIAALFVSTEGIIFILAVFSLDTLLKKIGKRNFYLLGIFAVISGLIPLGGARNPAGLWVGTIFLGIGLGMFNIINVSRIANIDSKKGKLAGFFTLFTVIGAMLGQILGGFIGDTFGLQAIFWALIPLFFILGLKIYFKPNSQYKRLFYETAK